MTETPENQAPSNTSVENGQATETGQGTTITESTTDSQKSQTGSEWFDSFKNEDLGYIQNKGWDKPEGTAEMLKSYQNLEKLKGVSEDKLLKIPNDDDVKGWDNLYSKLGKPESAEGYKYKAPENTEVSTERLAWFDKTAHELNLNKAQHNKLVNAAMEYENGILEKHNKDVQLESDTQIAELKDSWGKAYDERVELGKRAVRAFADGNTVDKLEQAMGNSADVIKLFANIGEKLGEDSIIIKGSERAYGYTPEQAKADKRELMNEIKIDPIRLSAFNKGKGSDYEKVEKLNKILLGN